MMLLLFFFSGLILSFIGALPLGTVNLAVINNSISKKNKAVKTISIAASFSEIIIAIFAYTYGRNILNFIIHNSILQYLMIVILFILGLYFLTQNKKTKPLVHLKIPDFGKGFTLGIVNPSVWLYWVIIISLLKEKITHYNPVLLSFSYLFIFFTAIYIGKLLALLLYSKIGHLLNKQKRSFKNTIIGSLLTITATAQLISKLL